MRKNSRVCIPRTRIVTRALFLAGFLAALGWAQSNSESNRRNLTRPPEFESDTLKHAEISRATPSLKKIRKRGLEVFATPFTAAIGYGDGPPKLFDPGYPTLPGRRPTLQDNGMFLRVNGLDSQTCLECHSVQSSLTVPFTFGVGGVGFASSNVLFQPTVIDVADSRFNGFAAFNGRFINPPFLFGSGGVELLAKEMTAELQALKRRALTEQGPVQLIAKGVYFGYVQTQGEALDTSNVHGVDEDLVVRPFGRKGEFATVREFDIEAMQFHFGMQPVEVVGRSIDDDADGISDEVSEGDLSALSIFVTHLERPVTARLRSDERAGEARFQALGCAGCHIPVLHTSSPILTYSFPEVASDPSANVYYQADLQSQRPGFDPSPQGGIKVPLFSDLKRHDMGPGLAESFGASLDRWFITARLWGVADTAPYLHDGRAHTLEEAIMLHGGEAQAVRDAYSEQPEEAKRELIAYLMTLRTPAEPASDLVGQEE